jgi:parallel beta-helix repeat protein
VLYDCGDDCIYLSGAGSSVVVGNDLVDGGADGIEITSAGLEYVIDGNSIIDMVGYGILVIGPAGLQTKTIISANRVALAGQDGIETRAGDVIVAGCRVTSSTGAGIDCQDFRSLVIGCNVGASGSINIAVEQSGVVAGCYVEAATTTGIEFQDRSVVYGNIVNGGVDGIECNTTGGGSVVVGNVVTGQTNNGIEIKHDYSTISMNLVYDVDTDGIELTACDHCSVYGNVVNTAVRCIDIDGCDGTTVCGNITTGGTYSVRAATTQYASICGNVFHNSSSIAIYVLSADYSTISGNVVATPGGQGITGTSATYLSICGNTIYDPNGDGIALSTSPSKCSVCGNMIYSPVRGVEVTSGSYMSVCYNSIYGPSADGIYVSTTSYATVNGNVVYDVSDTGITVTNSGGGAIMYSVAVCGNVLFANLDGIEIAGSSSYEIRGAVVAGNVLRGDGGTGDDGIIVSYVEYSSVLANRVDNFDDGIDEDANSDNNLFGVNMVEGNSTALNLNGTNRTSYGNKT